MTLDLVGEAERAGARRAAACAVLGVSVRTVERWRRDPAARDQRSGPTTVPANTLTPDERREILATVNAPRFRDLSPNQIVPLLADEGRYLASEATLYRILRAEALLHHRERSQAPVRRPPMAHTATGPNQVWSWDITYLRSPVRGIFFYLYLVVDVWSRKIMAWDAYEAESAELAAGLIEGQCAALGLDPQGLVLHADNGGPMKGATMVATLERLGILASFSRPRVSDDNPYSEALFRTLKYRPEYPDQPFEDVAAARAWVATFVRWYNTEHLHSGIRFVTPEDRHSGREAAILAGRRALYASARAARPERWSRGPRCWTPIERVYLNPERPTPLPPTTAPTPAVAAAPPPPVQSAPATGRWQPAAPRGRADHNNHCTKIPATTILTFTGAAALLIPTRRPPWMSASQEQHDLAWARLYSPR
jgi:putative transposase